MSFAHSIHERTNCFALAIAAIVTVLALASPVKAEIIYHKLNIVINEGDYNLDLNGVTYFTIHSGVFGCNFSHLKGDGVLFEAPASGSGAIVGPLRAGDEIGPDQMFSGETTDLVKFLDFFTPYHGWHCGIYSWSGTWCPTARSGFCEAIKAYLGLRFEVDGTAHYGWLEVSIPADSISATLLGYAYDTTPGMSIKAGQTH